MKLVDAAGTVIATTVTDSVGDFEFTYLAPGVYGLMQINASGFTDVIRLL